MLGQMKRFDAIPLVQAGGHQPYSPHGGRLPGDALMAMLAGSTLYGVNPADVQRNMQAAMKASPDQTSLLSRLATGYASGHNVTPGGTPGPGDWVITPDQRDRNGEHSQREWAKKHPWHPRVPSASNPQWS